MYDNSKIKGIFRGKNRDFRHKIGRKSSNLTEKSIEQA